MLRVNNISKSFFGKTILDNLNYNFPENKIIGLIGINGAGKTTFLNIISGIEEADGGEILKSKNLKIGYLPQSFNSSPAPTIVEECMAGHTELYEQKLLLGELYSKMEVAYSEDIYEEYQTAEYIYRQKRGYELEAGAEKILLGLGFTREQFEKDPHELSGGWRMRLELAKVLLTNPDFLILDEPTNHLDLPTIIWLENYLKNYKGTLLFISHDEELLNRLPQIILHLKDNKLNEYYGNYEDFLRNYELVQLGKVAEIKNLQKRQQELSTFVDKFKAGTRATQAKSKEKMLTKLNVMIGNVTFDNDDPEIRIKIPLEQKSANNVIIFSKCGIGYDKPLIKNLSLLIQRGQKIAIIGANGLGKTTLLKTIATKLNPLGGEFKVGNNVNIGYYAQDQLESLDTHQTVLENLRNANDSLPDREVRRILGSFLFKSDDVKKPVSVLSGGEKSRLSLAALLVQKVNLLLLDEPTNHLDMTTSEILAETLKAYQGTVVFVSHNRKFINSAATHILLIKPDGKVEFKEGVEENFADLFQ